MAAPSKVFTVIADSRIDPDSPLDTTLFTDLRNNDIHLEEWLGHSYVAAQDHNHDSVNSARISNFQVWLKDLFASGTFDLTMNTGAIPFPPSFCIVVGVASGGAAAGWYYFVGFATGTGTGASSNGLYFNTSGTLLGLDTDPDAVGGEPNAGFGSDAFDVDVDVTEWSQSNVQFYVGGGASTRTYRLKTLFV